MSSLLTIGLYFVFHRFWSVRNLDIALLILLAPGMLMVHEGRRRELRELETQQIAAQRLQESSRPTASHETRRYVEENQQSAVGGSVATTLILQVAPEEVQEVLTGELADAPNGRPSETADIDAISNESATGSLDERPAYLSGEPP